MCGFLFLATCDRTLYERLRKVLTDIDDWRLRGKSDGTIARRQFVTTSWNRNANISSADSKMSAIYLIRTSRSLFPEVAQLHARLQSARYNLYPFQLNCLVWINRNSKIVQNVYPCFDHFLVISMRFTCNMYATWPISLSCFPSSVGKSFATKRIVKLYNILWYDLMYEISCKFSRTA